VFFFGEVGIVSIEFLVKLAIDGRDFGVCNAVIFTLGVEDGMDV